MVVFFIGLAGIVGMGYPKVCWWLLTILAWGYAPRVDARDLPVVQDSYLDSTVADTAPDYRKLRKIFAVQSGVYLGSLYGLSKSWYKNPLKNFHFRDDRHVWLQMDKAGHFFTSYQISRYTAEIYGATGISRRQRILYGALSGFLFQTPIELLDGFSPDYGFSISDVAANFAGSALFAGQMLVWNEIRILPKFSGHLSGYAEVRPQLLGHNFPERLLKDYNGQTYWLSFSPRSFHRTSFWPSWLCISVGYGVENMVSAETLKSQMMGFRPYRQYYLSLDVDLTRITFKNRFLRSMATVFNSVKIPAPAMEIGGNGHVRFRPFYF